MARKKVNARKRVTKRVTKRSVKRPYVIVRCRDAGVHAGEYVKHSGREVQLFNARRIWFWKGAASLSELAVHGAKNPSECKFSVPVDTLTLLDACEIIHCQPAGAKMIRECAEWRA